MVKTLVIETGSSSYMTQISTTELYVIRQCIDEFTRGKFADSDTFFSRTLHTTLCKSGKVEFDVGKTHFALTLK